MIINKDIEDHGRVSYAMALLESSGYDEEWKDKISDDIFDSSPDEIETIIEHLLLNQVDRWSNFRNKDINRRLDRCL